MRLAIFFAKCFPHLNWTWGIFHRMLSVPQDIVMDLNNVMKVSLKSWKLTCFNKDHHPTFDILYGLKSVWLASKPPISMTCRRDVWFWPRDGYIITKSLSKVGDHHFRWLQKEIHGICLYVATFLARVKHSPSFTKIGGFQHHMHTP